MKQIAIQQSIAWSNMLNSRERDRNAVRPTSALNKIEISLKAYRYIDNTFTRKHEFNHKHL